MKKITLQTDLSKNIAPPVYVFLLFLLLFFSALSAFAQAGKDGALTVTTANTVLNRYTRVTTDVLAGSNTITVADINDLNRDGITYLPGGFVTNSSVYANNALSTGDLVVMYQAQGAIINATNTINYGTVTNFNGAGTFEFATVESVSGNTITLGCRTKNSYFADRYVQVLRVPQYTTLTVNAGASVAAIPWGSPAFGGADPSALTRRRGGFMVVHSTNIVNNGTIHANEAGFRGGTRENNTSAAGANFYTDFRTNDSNLSAEKGESIAGYRDDYDNLYNGRYGRGAPANGGGGGNAHNAGGGGGANGGNPAGWFRGAGVMNDFRPAAGGCGNPGAWALDPDYIANGNALTNSQGGGRGGYSYASSNQNACILGPSYPANFISPGVPAADVQNTAWGGDRRDAVGGLGGRPLVSNSFQNQIFFGGGGGAGDGNNNANNDGGDGGGIVFLIATGNITGSGIISANGENGFNTLPSHNDAPGGGGGGGTVAIQTTSIANTISIRANGGNGGSQLITNSESEGPGGGGGGGVIAINATTDGSTKQVNGGQNGTTSSAAVTEFIANGATSGNSGTITTVSVNLFSVVCTANLGINKTVDNSTPNVGSNVTFTITVTNAGPDPATGVVVNDLLPSGYTFVSSTPSQGTYNSGTGVWNVGNIAIGGNATLTIIATVNATGSYTNTATVTGDQNDPNLTNNTSSVTPTPVPQTNLGVTKTASNMTPPVGSNITFTITASNAGPSNATGVVVNDLLPSGYTFVSATASQGTYNNVTGVWSVGALANGGSATLTITVTVNATGSYANTATISGNENDPTPANNTSTSTPTPVNLAPDAVNDSYTMPQNGNLSNSVATNDILQAGGNPHTFSLVSGGSAAANGTLVFNSDGTFTYTPNTGFSGTVSFTYQVCNSVTPVPQCDTAVATIVVLPPPVAVNDTAATPINTPVNGNASTNDNLPSGGTYTYTVTTPPANGSVVMNPDGTYTYTPNTGFTGTDTFTYQVCNQVGQCSTATVTVTVLPPPVAVNDSAVTPINTPVNGNASTNDNLPSGGTYTYTVTTLPANGSVVMNPDGTYTYTPNTGFTGTDTFTYQVCNQVGQCSTATVTVTVLPPPVAVIDSAVTPINTPVNGIASTNDNLPSGGTYTYTVTTPPTNGNVTMNPDGTYTYTPNTGFTGTDTFTYQVCNQVGQCSTATVTVTVLPPPVAVNDSAVTPINTPVSGDLGTNDNLPAGGTYTFSLVDGGSAAVNGTLVVNPDGTYTFTPNAGFSGVVTFTYQVCNQAGVCSTATVTITVLAPPVANNDTAGTLPNTPVNGNVSSNDNLPAGGTYTYTVATPPANGSVVMNPDGTYTYTPNPGFVGTDTFTYTVCNQLGECSTATVTITVGQPPVANNDEYNTGANTPVSGNVGTNDQNPSGGTTTYNLVNGGTAAQNGTLVFNPDGTFTFTPNQGFVGTVTFTYEICNPVGCSQATVTINVAAPVQANDDNFNATPGNPVNGNVGANDQIPAGQNPTYTLVNGGTAAANGTLVFNPNGTFTFTPNAGFVGTVSFTYQVCNEFGQCSTATVTIVVEDPVVQIPEGFSPNNDGINDTFVIKGRNGRPVDLKIYNRWGNLVYENPNYQDEWNGTSNIGIRIGEQLPDGTYYYTAEFKDTGERYARYLTIRR